MMGTKPQEAADVAEGWAALTRALDMIGDTKKTDHDLAKIIVDHELQIRMLLVFALTKLAIG
jgi:hypothetical protein